VVWLGIVLGVTVLNERVDGRLILGTALIIGGIDIANARLCSRPRLRWRASVEATDPG
jgi:hypothetical protein